MTPAIIIFRITLNVKLLVKYHEIIFLLIFKMKEDKLDFFPSDRAICLDRVPEDSTESKVDDIMDTVNKILQKQEEQVFIITFSLFYQNFFGH